MPDDVAIEVAALRRAFGGRRGTGVVVALAGVDLSIPAGEVHGLLGPNGAGKTTLCKILSTVLLATSGRVAVAGHEVVAGTVTVRRTAAADAAPQVLRTLLDAGVTSVATVNPNLEEVYLHVIGERGMRVGR